MAMSAMRIIKPVGPAPKFTDDLRIFYVPGAKKIGTISGDRYAIYCTARTIGEAVKLGSKRADTHWDWEKGYMQVLSPGAAPPAPKMVVDTPAAKISAKSAKPATTPQKQAPKQQPVPVMEKTPEKMMVTPQKAPAQAAPPSPVKRVRSLALHRVLQRATKLAAQAQRQMGAQAAAAVGSSPVGEAVVEQGFAAVAAESDANAVEVQQPEKSAEQEEKAQEVEVEDQVKEAQTEEVTTAPAGTEEQPENQEKAEEKDEADGTEEAQLDVEEPEAKRARIEQPEEGDVMESA